MHALQRMRRRLTAAGLALIVTLAPLGSVPQVLQAAPGNQGLQGGWAIDDSGQVTFYHSLSTQYPLMQQAGAGWVRVNFRLGACFQDWTSIGCTGQTAVQTYDQVIGNALSHNLRVLGLLSNESWPGTQTQWTANNAEHNRRGTGDNPYLQQFAQGAAGTLASAYQGRRTITLGGTTYALLVGAWEVWNEPNAWTSNPSPGVYTGSTFIYPSNFAWLLKRANAALKQGNPSATVISGGLFGHDPGGAAMTTRVAGSLQPVQKQGVYRAAPGQAPATGPAGSASNCTSTVPSGADYLCSTYQMGLSKAGWQRPYPFDHVGQHLYVDQGTTTSAAKLGSYLQDLRTAYLTYEGTGTPKQTHLTEFGWSTASVSPAVQAQNVQTSYQTFRPATTPYLARAYWFSIQDVPEGGVYYGLVEADGVTDKPAFTSYQTYAVY
jgi:hypothetical protein